LGYVRTNSEHCLGLGMINSAGDVDFLTRNADVETSARRTACATARKPGGDVRLVGCLIAAETRIAIDAKNRSLGLAHVLWRELREFAVQGFDELHHRLPNEI